MAKQKTPGRGCMVVAIAILLIISLITAFIVVVLNLTPNQIGLAEVAIIDGNSANELELGDSKIKEVIRLILEKINNKT